MNSTILFSEKQRFTQWWLWLILLFVNGLFGFGVVKQVVLGQQFGDEPIGNAGLLIAAGITLSISLMFLFSKLETRVTAEGISVRFLPFHWKYKTFTWDELTKVYIRQYSPILDFGGWGLRYSISGNGKAYNMSGNHGLQLEFTNGKKLLIGTKKADELSVVLQQPGK